MNKNKPNEQKESEALFKIMIAVGAFLAFYGKFCIRGASVINWKNANLYLLTLFWLVISALIMQQDYWGLRTMGGFYSSFGTEGVFYYIATFGWLLNLFLLWFLPQTILLAILGVREAITAKKYEQAFKQLGFKNSLKVEPKVKRVIKIDDNRSLIKVSSPGVSPEEWQKKKEALAFDFKADIDEIRVSDDRNYIELYLSEKPLPRVVKFQKYEDYIKEPYTFMVGEAKNGEIITESIRNCPHVLMGGATGMGKSTSFKLMLYSLLKNSPEDQISFTLLDLKRGVEVAEFGGFSNVTIAKNESSAVKELKKISEEMHRRYKYLEQQKRTKIDPEEDKKPLIILAVDEASVIFGAKSKTSDLKGLSYEARELCQEIAKLGRAAGIHMILATQRATKTSIDTTTLDNLEARICFRTRSVPGSTAILGDKSGSTLPDIPGRAIWQKGIKSVNLQVPYLPEEALTKLCNDLKKERSKGENKVSESAKDEKEKALDTVLDHKEEDSSNEE